MAFSRVIAVLTVLLIVAACATGPQATPTLVRLSPTPVSTALPGIATVVPAGLPDNPLRMALVPVDMAAARALKADLEQAILEATNVTIEILLMESTADLLAALCNTSAEQVSVAWLDGLGYAAARAQNCGEAVLRAQRGVDRGAVVGEAGQIILTRTLGTTSLDVLNGRTFCRLGYQDLYSWLLPTIIMRRANVNPASLGEIIDLPDLESLVAAVAQGDCAGAGVSVSALEQLDSPDVAQVRISSTTPPLPYAILVYPYSIPLAARLSLTDGLVAFSEALAEELAALEATPEPTSEATAEADTEATPEVTAEPEPVNLLAAFLPATDLVRVQPGDFTAFEQFLNQARFDFAVLGQ